MAKYDFINELDIFDEPEMVRNPYSGESCELSPTAVAVYDYIKGCELFGDYNGVREGLDWFRANYPREYMILLD